MNNQGCCEILRPKAGRSLKVVLSASEPKVMMAVILHGQGWLHRYNLDAVFVGFKIISSINPSTRT